jgi:hypothetical protein
LEFCEIAYFGNIVALTEAFRKVSIVHALEPPSALWVFDYVSPPPRVNIKVIDAA